MGLTDNQAKVRDALSEQAPLAPIAVADATGLGYSTVTRLLRELGDAGLAVKDTEGWRRTTTDPDPDADPVGEPAEVELAETVTGDLTLDEAQPDEESPATVAAGLPEPADDPAPPNPPSENLLGDDHTAGPVAPAEPDDQDDAVSEPDLAEPVDATTDAPADEMTTAAVKAPTRKPRMGKGELREQVLTALRAAAKPLGPTQLSKLLPGKSQGAISNACDRLVTAGLAVLDSEKPRRFKATPTT
jgi:hypothetical protein